MPTDETPERVFSSGRRIWQRANPSQGSSRLALLAMSVLYDAGEPLTREAIAERLIVKLDPYQRGYLEAWYQHRSHMHRRDVAKAEHRDYALSVVGTPPTLSQAVRNWITQVFLQRVRSGSTLERLPDGRYQPGKTAPRILMMDGRRLAFTPEARHEVERDEMEAGRRHLVNVELDRLVRDFGIHTRAARTQFLVLLMRKVFSLKSEGPQPLDERKLVPQLTHLLRLIADTPARQRELLQRAFDALWIDESS